ncbi:MAG: hypothetical protein AB2689_27320 [Candidatus Thiodiazotropha taylori]
MPRWLENRTLGTVFWLEAPALYILFVLLGYGLWFILKSGDFDQEITQNVFIAILGLGVVAASVYTWLVSKNTSRQLFTVLARLSVLFYIGLFISMLFFAGE